LRYHENERNFSERRVLLRRCHAWEGQNCKFICRLCATQKEFRKNLKKARDDKENKELTDHKVIENSREHSRIENEIPHSILIKVIFVT